MTSDDKEAERNLTATSEDAEANTLVEEEKEEAVTAATTTPERLNLRPRYLRIF